MPRYRLYKGKPRHLVADPHSPLGAQQYVGQQRCAYVEGDVVPAEFIDRFEQFEQVRRAGVELERAVEQGHLLALSDKVVAVDVGEAMAKLQKPVRKAAPKPPKGDS